MAKQKKRGASGFGVSLTSPGSPFVWMLIGIVIVAAVLLSKGIFPKSTLTEPEDVGEIIVIEEPTDDDKGSLQLRTIKFKECSSLAAVGMLVDRSGSMDSGSKLSSLKNALSVFTKSLGDESIIGIQSFSDPRGVGGTVSEDVPFSKYGDIKAEVANAINQLRARGATNTRTAFQFAKDKIVTAQQQYPDNEFAMIFLSDGIPESSDGPCRAALNARCFETTEDPTNPPNLAQEIKDAGIRLYSITILNEKDTGFQDQLTQMMENIASPDSYFATANPSDLEGIYREIATSICNDLL